MKNGSINVPKPVKASQGMEHDETEQEKRTKDTISKSASSRGIVDWDGPETEKNGSASQRLERMGKIPGSQIPRHAR